MRRLASRASAADWGLAALVVLVTAGNAWWVARNRRLLEVDVDEAILLVDSEHVRHGVASGWFDMSTSAPLLRMTTAAATALFGRSPLVVSLPVLAANALLLIAVYVLARQLGARSWSLLAAALVGVAPVAVEFSRSYHQIIPAAAALVVSQVAALRSHALSDRRWSVAFGACLGVALLVRTMLLPFIPLVVLGTVLEWRLGGRTRPRFPIGNLLRALAAMVLVAATWWAVNAADAVRYLVNGPVPGASDSGLGSHVFSGRELRQFGRALAGPEAYSVRWLLVLVVAVGTAVLVVAAGRARAITPRQANVAFLVAAGLVVLGLNADAFDGFVLLVVPSALASIVALAARSPGWPARVVLGAVGGLVAFGIVSYPRADAGWYAYGMQVRSGWTSPSGRVWATAYPWVLDDEDGSCAERIVVLRAHPLLGAKHLQWAAIATDDAAQVSRAEDAGRLPSPDRLGRAGWLVLDVDADGDGAPPIERYDAGSLRKAGLAVERQRTLPDGSVVRIWSRPGAPTCHPVDPSGGP